MTEGAKTEPDYFRLLVDELGLTAVEISSAAGSAPISVVEDAKKRLSKDKDFEQVYGVFDRDRHDTYEQALDKWRVLKKRYKNKIVRAITSVPCFELWYLLHVSNSRKPYPDTSSPADDLIADLTTKSPFKNYQKNNCDSFFAKIREQRQDAVARAEHFLNEARKDGDREFHENPSTRVHCLVKALIDLSKNPKFQNIL